MWASNHEPILELSHASWSIVMQSGLLGIRDCGPRSCRPSPSGRWASLSGPARTGFCGRVLFCKQVGLYGLRRCCKRRVAAALVSPLTLPAKACSQEVTCQRCLNSKKLGKAFAPSRFPLVAGPGSPGRKCCLGSYVFPICWEAGWEWTQRNISFGMCT